MLKDPHPCPGLSASLAGICCSGLRFSYLKVWERSGYKSDVWVKKVTRGGEYHTRLEVAPKLASDRNAVEYMY